MAGEDEGGATAVEDFVSFDESPMPKSASPPLLGEPTSSLNREKMLLDRGGTG